MTVLGVVAGGLLCALGVLWLGQRRLIYFPDAEAPPLPTGVEEVSLRTEDGLELTAWWVAGPEPHRAEVVVFPGNAGNRAGRLPLAGKLVDEGFGVLLVDYRGYGGNPGSPSAAGLLADAHAAGRWLDEHATGPVVYLGESLGCAPATYLAGIRPPVGLVLRSPFPSLVDVSKQHYPLLPAELLLRDRFPIATWLEAVESPIWVVAGSADSIIPLPLSRAVAEQAEAELVVVEGSDHNDASLATGRKLIETVARATG